MIVVDVNLLLYAHFTAFPEHPRARDWWEGLVNGERAVGVAVPALFGFLRLATSRRVFERPMSVEAAIGCSEAWMERPHVQLLAPGPRHVQIAFRLLRDVGAAGNLTTDVQLAALAIEYQAELHSNDRDFARFSELRWVNPMS